MTPLVLAIGLLLALPTVRGAIGGQIDPGTALARSLMGMAVAWAAVALVRSVVSHNTAEPAEDPAGASPAEGT
ncbi:MAG TPA: hypothetical protein VFH50_06855 [Acidimicrobiales bacterium]|nr:hypothetical protein [Acidimicrobiales bacterium]